MKQIIVRTDKFKNINLLSYEERGKLFTILMLMGFDSFSDEERKEYETLSKEFCGDRFLNSLVSIFVKDFAEYKKKYDSVAKRNRENGKKGGRPRKTQTVVEQTQTVFEEPKETLIDNGYSTNNLNHNINIPTHSTPTLEEVLAAANQCMVHEELAMKFFYHYDSESWMINGRPITNWRSKLMEWKNNPSYNVNTDTNTNDFHASRKQKILSSIELSGAADAEAPSDDGFVF